MGYGQGSADQPNSLEGEWSQDWRCGRWLGTMGYSGVL
jgi:hypothetical protein